jgi:hypothetical protein
MKASAAGFGFRAGEEGVSRRGRGPPVEVSHLDFGHLDAVIFVLLVVHLC